MLRRLKDRLSPGLIVGTAALFVALGGPGYAATGANFILGTPNTATSETSLAASGGTTMYGLRVSNTNQTGGAAAARFEVPAGHAPFSVNRNTKVTSLNADLVDGLSSTAFVRKGVAESGTPTTGSGI